MSGARSSGGLESISNWARLLQPCRIAVATQSVPVSPPPMTMTSLSLARDEAPVLEVRSRAGSWCCSAGTRHRGGCPGGFVPRRAGPSARWHRPARTTASKSLTSCLAGRCFPTSVFVTNVTPFGGHQVDAALDYLLVKLHVGDAVHQQASYAVRPLVYGDRVTRLVELGGAGQTSGP